MSVFDGSILSAFKIIVVIFWLCVLVRSFSIAGSNIAPATPSSVVLILRGLILKVPTRIPVLGSKGCPPRGICQVVGEWVEGNTKRTAKT